MCVFARSESCVVCRKNSTEVERRSSSGLQVANMADLEAVLADVSYLMAMEKSKNTPAARASKKIVLPDPSVRSVMIRYLSKRKEMHFDSIFNQKLGFLLFKEFCESASGLGDSVPQLKFYEETKRYQSLETVEERQKKAREIYDNYVMKELLSHTHNYSKDAVDHVQRHLMKNEVPVNLFQPYIQEIFSQLKGDIFDKFLERSVLLSSIVVNGSNALFLHVSDCTVTGSRDSASGKTWN